MPGFFSARILHWVWILAVWLLGCATEEPVIVEAQQDVHRVDTFLYAVEKAYREREDLSRFFTPAFLKDQAERLEKASEALQKAQQVEIEFTVDLIQVGRQTMRVLLHWSAVGQWPQGKVHQQGNATFLLVETGEGLRIDGIEGENPFFFTGQPGPSLRSPTEET